MAADPTEDGSIEPSAELRRTFWVIVAMFDVAMLAIAIGVLLVVVEGRNLVGGSLLAVGLLAFAAGYRRIKARRNT